MITETAALTDLEQRVIARIQESDWVSLTTEMVRTVKAPVLMVR